MQFEENSQIPFFDQFFLNVINTISLHLFIARKLLRVFKRNGTHSQLRNTKSTLSARFLFVVIVDDRRRSRIAESSGIVCDHMETHFCDRLRSSAILRSGSQTIAEDRTMFYFLRSSAIVRDRLRSFAILRSYGNQSSAICDRNVSHNNFNSDSNDSTLISNKA